MPFQNLFIEHLKPSISKWSPSDKTQSFKVQVAVRFKPGLQENNKLVLPLHQVLKFRTGNQKLSKNFKSD